MPSASGMPPAGPVEPSLMGKILRHEAEWNAWAKRQKRPVFQARIPCPLHKRDRGTNNYPMWTRLHRLMANQDWIAKSKIELRDAWPTVLPLCALMIALAAPLAATVCALLGYPSAAQIVMFCALLSVLLLSLISRVGENRRTES